jgi:hypothetical protein
LHSSVGAWWFTASLVTGYATNKGQAEADKDKQVCARQNALFTAPSAAAAASEKKAHFFIRATHANQNRQLWIPFPVNLFR